MANPGTSRNNERTGKRDAEWDAVWSEIMRKPSFGGGGSLRSCDFDTTAICDVCSLPIMMYEATRDNIEDKSHRYTDAIARGLGIPAYVAWHNEDGSEIKLIRTVGKNAGKSHLFTKEKFIAWVEKKYEEHVNEKHPLEKDRLLQISAEGIDAF